MKIYRKNDKIIFEEDFLSKRINPYMLDDNGEPEDVGKHKTLVGIISKDESGNEELGFALLIDMAYKDKPDQNTDIKYHCWNYDKDEFIKLCKELDVEVLEYPICDYCNRPMFGAFKAGDKGDMCYDCELKGKE